MIILYYILFFFLIIFILLGLLFLLQPLFSFVPFIPVQRKVLDEIFLNLKLEENSVLYDLGCGDGRILFEAKKRNRSISCVGIEIAPFPFLFTKIKSLLHSSKNIHILYGNFFNIDISPASHIFLYLFPEVLDDLLPKFEKELKPGTRIVSCDFQFSKREPNKVIEIKPTKWQKNKKLYIYDF